MKKAERERVWRRHIQGWRDSGLSGLKYCQREHVSLKQFYQWRKRLATENWLPVSLAEDNHDGAVRIALGDGLQVIVEENSSPAALRLALDALT